MPPFTPSAHTGVVHRYASRLVAFEHAAVSTDPKPNTLIWIGGLGDGLLTVSYLTKLAQVLPSNWVLAQVLIYASYTGWGTSSLKRDAKELGKCVAYFRKLRPGTNIVLMGHSTGCQDIMEYLVGEGREERFTLQGAILQASVSDREALVEALPDGAYEKSVKIAQQFVREGRGDDTLPKSSTHNFFGAPVTAERWLSLCSPNKDGADDFFSSDLPLEKLQKTFGAMKKETPLLLLYSGDDEFVPDFVDKKALVSKWMSIVKDGGGVVDEVNGGVVEGAHHNLETNDDEVIQDLFQRTKGFLARIDSGDFKTGAHL